MLCSNQLSYVAIFSASPSSALRGALCVVDLIASTNFFPKSAYLVPFVWVVNSMVRKASTSRFYR
ncbi:hypothetical protein EH207_05415 [Brenneria rubrifaciens]|uniref:Uncharacterized protein n=1 Tax=Brenneria rubrifaciens TaxID=55213 RepID=A0A4P8QV30_9GAMM|nr:hypothetical protein EH207_05415 [Brenneria rubrifaciens]